MEAHPHSLLERIPCVLPDELTETLCRSASVRIERIVSRGHGSPSGFWYDQDENEFVLLVEGRAGLRVDGRDDELVLGKGDWLELKAHVRHRVEWTAPDQDTIWLAVFYR